MSDRTPLYAAHTDAEARMVDFSGWEMPLNYGSQLEEHHAVRTAAGMFDVSHMTVVDIRGESARAFLRHLLANDIDKLKSPGRALYGCMLNESGGVVDDLISYFLEEGFFRLIVNAATRDKDLAWIEQHAKGFGVEITERPQLAMVAVQGPKARACTVPLLPDALQEEAADLRPFSAAISGDWFVARTGYTGEDGFEVVLPPDEAEDFWQGLVQAGVKPCGLGARDSLRLEAGLNLYGQDMDETTHPYESNLGWTVALDEDSDSPRQFIGREALLKARADGLDRKLVGLVLEDRGVLRPGVAVHGPDELNGQITSGGFAPTLERSIALARVPTHWTDGLTVDVRGKALKVRMVKPPFARNGDVCDGIV